MSAFVQLLGLAALVAAAFLVGTIAGLLALGVSLILCGFALDGVSLPAIAASLWRRLPLRRGREVAK